MTDAEVLWLEAYRELILRGAHEIKGTLNGMALNLEVLRTRAQKATVEGKAVAPFADAAYDEFEKLSARIEAHLFLARPHRGDAPVDISVTVKHMATMLGPAARADGVGLEVEGFEVPAPTSAGASAVRLALATGLLALIKEGGRCRVEPGSGAVVRFSHQSANTPAGSLGPQVEKAIAAEGIRAQEAGSELTLVFPKYE